MTLDEENGFWIGPIRDLHSTNQTVPAGYERLASLRERMGSDALLVALQTGDVDSFEFIPEDGRPLAVPVDYWRSEHGHRMLESGCKDGEFGPEDPDHPADGKEFYFYGSKPAWRVLVVKKDIPEVGTPAGAQKEDRSTDGAQIGRPPDTGYRIKDALIVEKMQELKASGKCKSWSEAAWEVIGRDGRGAEGGGTPESKVRRLVNRAKG